MLIGGSHTARRNSCACCRESAPGEGPCTVSVARAQCAHRAPASWACVVYVCTAVCAHVRRVGTRRAWEVDAVRGELGVAEAARVGVHHLDAQLRGVGARSMGVGLQLGRLSRRAPSPHVLCTATSVAGQAGAGVWRGQACGRACRWACRWAGGACLSEDGRGALVVDARDVGVHDGPLPRGQLAARDRTHLLGVRLGAWPGARLGLGLGVRLGVMGHGSGLGLGFGPESG